ncbi:phage portal protein [Xanthobacter versatilis]|uniref:phage portal protein n=1 Tax=Xanthobacter autotrophicus (strain ATCC BAA-1158 / Py2) TaxID=78245 RepID=UPI0037278B73
MGLLDRIASGLGFRSAPVEAAGSGPRWGRTAKVLRAPAREIAARRQLAAERAAWLSVNDPVAAAIVATWASNLVKDGPAVAARTADMGLRASLGDRFDEWWNTCDAEGVDDFAGILNRIARCLVGQGEAFIIAETDEAGALVLRTVDPSQVDASLSRLLADGGSIVAGVELDARGRRRAYWIKPASDHLLGYGLQAQRVSASDVFHLYRKDFSGQVRGLSWLSPVATYIDQLAELTDSELALQNTAALFGGILVNTNGTVGEDIAPAAGLSPGALTELPAGYDVRFASPPTSNGASAFRKSILRAIATGVQLPYELVSGDLSEVNFSSARLGLFEFRNNVDALRKSLIGARFLEPLWRRWLAHEALAGRLSATAAASVGLTASWPGWGSIDPKGETEADVLAVANGFASRAEIVARRGRDLRELDAERAADSFVPPTNGGNKQ